MVVQGRMVDADGGGQRVRVEVGGGVAGAEQVFVLVLLLRRGSGRGQLS